MAAQIETPQALHILRRKQVQIATGLSRSTIYSRIQDGTFPPAVQLGPRAVGWKSTDIDVFLSSLPTIVPGAERFGKKYPEATREGPVISKSPSGKTGVKGKSAKASRSKIV